MGSEHLLLKIKEPADETLVFTRYVAAAAFLGAVVSESKDQSTRDRHLSLFLEGIECVEIDKSAALDIYRGIDQGWRSQLQHHMRRIALARKSGCSVVMLLAAGIAIILWQVP